MASRKFGCSGCLELVYIVSSFLLLFLFLFPSVLILQSLPLHIITLEQHPTSGIITLQHPTSSPFRFHTSTSYFKPIQIHQNEAFYPLPSCCLRGHNLWRLSCSFSKFNPCTSLTGSFASNAIPSRSGCGGERSFSSSSFPHWSSRQCVSATGGKGPFNATYVSQSWHTNHEFVGSNTLQVSTGEERAPLALPDG